MRISDWSSDVCSSDLLLHGAQADALVLCHEPTRPHMRGLPTYKLPDVATCMAANLEAGRLTNPAVKFVGISINTANLDAAAAERYLKELSDTHGRSEEHTSELQSLMRNSYAVF